MNAYELFASFQNGSKVGTATVSGRKEADSLRTKTYLMLKRRKRLATLETVHIEMISDTEVQMSIRENSKPRLYYPPLIKANAVSQDS